MRRGWPASAAHVKEERGKSQREGSHGLEDERQELLARGSSSGTVGYTRCFSYILGRRGALFFLGTRVKATSID